MSDFTISIIALIISMATAILSVYFSIKSNRYAENALKIEMHVQKREFKAAVREWGFEAIDAINDALFLCAEQAITEDQFTGRLYEARRRISATIDKGRLFLPNEAHDEHGTYKGAAYRGFRPPALNVLVAAYNMTFQFNEKELAENRDLFDRFWNLRKEFVSELQVVVDPRENAAELDRLVREIRK